MIDAAPTPQETVAVAAEAKKTSPLLAVFIYFVVVFAGAAIIAPRFYSTAQFLQYEVSGRFHDIASQPFHRYMVRCLQLVAIIALPSLLKAFGIRSFSALGLKTGLRHFGEALQGIVWGVISLLLVSALLVASNIRVADFDHDSFQWLRHVKNAGIAAIVVSLLEEILFRGALFGALRRYHPFWPAALLSGAIYALLHFLEKPENPPTVEWNSGFVVLAQMFHGLTDWQLLVPAFLNLTLLGALLALALERTVALHFSIGLHAGLIFSFKTFGFLTNQTSKTASTFWGSDKLLDGWATTLILLVVFVLIERTLPPRKGVPA
jgi:uncharacterized protein